MHVKYEETKLSEFLVTSPFFSIRIEFSVISFSIKI